MDGSHELVDVESYEAEDNKLQWSIKWVIAKAATQVSLPEELLLEPFYAKDKMSSVLRLKTSTLYHMTNSTLYCATAAAIFQDQSYLSANHARVLQALNRHGIHCTDVDERPVTETMLSQCAPPRLLAVSMTKQHLRILPKIQTAHLALIDCLMMGYMRQVLTVERVVVAVRKHTVVNSNELPLDLEDALLFWINKITASVRDMIERKEVEAGGLDASAIPEMEDLYEEICDGCCMATLISFYFPNDVKLKDICFNEPMSIGDSLHNIRLVEHFCQHSLPANCFHCVYEDLLYTHEILKPNIAAFITDLFFYLECPDVVVSNSSFSEQNVSAGGLHSHKKYSIPDLRQGLTESCPKTISKGARTIPHDARLGRMSEGTSLMNSVDSLATNRTIDSLNYAAQAGSRLNAPPRGHVADVSHCSPAGRATAEKSQTTFRKSPTTCFAELGDAFGKQAPSSITEIPRAHSSSYATGRSANASGPLGVHSSSPHNYVNGNLLGSGGNVTSSSNNNSVARMTTPIRLQLEQKRLEFERQRQQLDAELARQRQAANEQAFLVAMGKIPSAMSQASSAGTNAAMSRSMHASPLPSSAIGHSQQRDARNINAVSSPLIEELSRNMLMLQQEIKRLSVEQNKMQQLFDSSGSNRLDGAAVDRQTANGDGCERRVLLDRPLDSESERSAMPPVLPVSSSFALTSSVPEPLCDQSRNANGGFQLHSNQHTASRDFADPQLELSNSPNFGLTYKLHRPKQSLGAENSKPASVQQQPSQWPFTPPNPQVIHASTLASQDGKRQLQPTSGNDGSAAAFTAVAERQDGPSDAELLGTTKLPSPSRGISDQLKTATSSLGFVHVAGSSERAQKELEMEKRKEQIMLSALRRKEEMESKRKRQEEEENRRRAEQQQKQEEAEQKKALKEMHRQKLLDDYQKKKAEQESLDNPPAPAFCTPQAPLRPKSTPSRGHSQPPRTRPQSQLIIRNSQSKENNASANVMSVSSSSGIIAGSANNLDQPDFASNTSDDTYNDSSLKLYVKPTQKSNRSIMYNALQYSCLPGAVNDVEKRKVLEELAKSDSKHFLVMFRDQKLQFRGLYSWDQVSDCAIKLYGNGPKSVPESSMSMMFKYDSGCKTFSTIPSKHLSATIDGFCLPEMFWQKKKSPFGRT